MLSAVGSKNRLRYKTRVEAVNPPKKTNPLKLVIQGLIAFLVSAFALWLSFKDVDQKDWNILKQSSAWAVGIYVAWQLFIHFLKIFRWGLLIKAIAPNITSRAVFSAANLGIAATFFIPLRLGEFVRPAVVARAGVPLGGAVASVFVERIADGLCAVAMFIIFFQFASPPPELQASLQAGCLTASIGFGGGLIFLIAAALARKPVLGLTKKILSYISEGLAEKLVNLVETFLDGLASLGSPLRTGAFLLLTIIYWTLNGLSTWALMAHYSPDMPMVSGLFAIAVLVFAIMVPAGPGFAGTFTLGFSLGFGAFGLDKSTGIVVGTLAQLINVMLMVSFVAMGFATAQAKVSAEPSQTEEELEPSHNPVA